MADALREKFPGWSEDRIERFSEWLSEKRKQWSINNENYDRRMVRQTMNIGWIRGRCRAGAVFGSLLAPFVDGYEELSGEPEWQTAPREDDEGADLLCRAYAIGFASEAAIILLLSQMCEIRPRDYAELLAEPDWDLWYDRGYRVFKW